MTEFVAAFGQGMRAPCRDAGRVRSLRGDGAPKSAKSLWLVPCGTRAPPGAPIAAFSGNGPCFRPVRRARIRRPIRQPIRKTLEDLPLRGGKAEIINNIRACYAALVKLEVMASGELPLIEAWAADLEVAAR